MTNRKGPARVICMQMLVMFAFLLTAARLAAQTYSYLPSASSTDDRFLSLAGGGINTLGDNPMTFKLASPAAAASIELGIFDGDTYGIFDQGSVPLVFTLYADPEGNGTGNVQVGEWHGEAMLNNDWYRVTVANSSAARCTCGDYFYLLKVRSSDPAAFHWSSFKLRTDGTISVNRNSNFTFSAPLGSAFDASVVYPAYPGLAPTTYDGTWHFHMDVPYSVSALSIYDGDFDRGSYDCTDNDTDDEDTPNSVPLWASGSAVAEGAATSSIACTDATGAQTGGTTTSNPPDNSRSSAFARGNGITYEVVDPNGGRYTNYNPSGNLEWEQFRISTGAFNRSMMDYHADALPAGTYDINIGGMDLGNLNALRFPYDVSGVDADGNVVTPLHPDYSDGSITGTVYYESGNNCTQGLLELGIPLASVHLDADFDGDGISDDSRCATTDLLGHFCFSGLHPGTYVVTVDPELLQHGTTPVCDTDGAGTPNTVTARLTMCARTLPVVFGYRLNHLLGALER
ncbi:MAG TPA: carboxypeptidase-like regulatory domain-containing protein [Candidatus Kapabacteria bacterium]|nr:carboxypeptidase-like regulatory domain-containing protein [Candidatus Kapabacteria bacterium]